MVVKSLNTNTNNNLIDWLELQDIDLDDLNNTTLNELSAAVSNDTRLSQQDVLSAYTWNPKNLQSIVVHPTVAAPVTVEKNKLGYCMSTKYRKNDGYCACFRK